MFDKPAFTSQDFRSMEFKFKLPLLSCIIFPYNVNPVKIFVLQILQITQIFPQTAMVMQNAHGKITTFAPCLFLRKLKNVRLRICNASRWHTEENNFFSSWRDCVYKVKNYPDFFLSTMKFMLFEVVVPMRLPQTNIFCFLMAGIRRWDVPHVF